MVFYSTYLLNPLGMWLHVRSAGFAGPFTPLAHSSLNFKLIPCFCSSSSQGWLETAQPAGLKSLYCSSHCVSQPGLGWRWVTAGSASPLLGTRSGKTGGRGAGTTKKLKAGLESWKGVGVVHHSATFPLGGEGSPLGLYLGGGGGGVRRQH